MNKQVYVLPKKLDEKVARLHLAQIRVKPDGPYKPDTYRYQAAPSARTEMGPGRSHQGARPFVLQGRRGRRHAHLTA